MRNTESFAVETILPLRISSEPHFASDVPAWIGSTVSASAARSRNVRAFLTKPPRRKDSSFCREPAKGQDPNRQARKEVFLFKPNFYFVGAPQRVALFFSEQRIHSKIVRAGLSPARLALQKMT